MIAGLRHGMFRLAMLTAVVLGSVLVVHQGQAEPGSAGDHTVDTAVEAVQEGDTASLVRQLHFRLRECSYMADDEPHDVGLVPCPDGVALGTMVPVAHVTGCEGAAILEGDPLWEQTMTDFVDRNPTLQAVLNGDPEWDDEQPRFRAIFDTAGTDAVVHAPYLDFSEEGIIRVGYGCGETIDERLERDIASGFELVWTQGDGPVKPPSTGSGLKDANSPAWPVLVGAGFIAVGLTVVSLTIPSAFRQ